MFSHFFPLSNPISHVHSNFFSTTIHKHTSTTTPLLTLTTFLGSQSVQAVITFSLRSNKSTEGKVSVASNDHFSTFVDVANGDLNTRVILCFNQSASGSALSWHVKVNEVTLFESRKKEDDQYFAFIKFPFVMNAFKHSCTHSVVLHVDYMMLVVR